RCYRDWSSDVCSSDLKIALADDAQWLAAETADDMHVVEFGEGRDQISLYDFELPTSRSAQSARGICLFSDRPVYNPGDTLHLKRSEERRVGKEGGSQV